ncbi:MAG: hypothetical protein HQL42_18770 [Alphaproteobacteria bacterium]|nr:hypothetical protein [Alphaproteobacteria bacterium]
MSNPRVSFEVQVLEDKNWVVTQFMADEGQAKAFAESLLQKGNHAAVRVVKDWQRLDGSHSETVVLEKTGEVKNQGPDLALGAISDAPICRGLGDFYLPEARQTIGRLVRKYLDELQVTPSELLHSGAELKRFGDKGNLLFSAIDRVATLQAAAAGEESKARRDFLSKAWDDILARARAFAAKKPPLCKTFAEIMAEVAKGGEHAGYATQSLMAVRLLDVRSYQAKIDILLAWAAEPQAATALEFIDLFIADTLLSAQLIQDLLGYQANLGAALTQLCDLAEGKASPAKFAPEATFSALNALFAKGSLPQSKAVLLARVMRELGGANPLSRNEPKQETEVFTRLAHRLVGHRCVLAQGAAAEALLHRVTRIHAHLGTVTASQAIDLMLRLLSDKVLKVQYLLALAQSNLAQGMADALAELIIARVSETEHIDKWVPLRLPPPERMAALAGLNAALVACQILAPEARAELGGKVDDVLATYLLAEEVIEKIDKPDDPLAMRAIRLIKFCGSGVLIEGRSLNLARARVIEHLKQPQFEEKFLASVPEPGKAEAHLREFHRLLVQTGFR